MGKPRQGGVNRAFSITCADNCPQNPPIYVNGLRQLSTTRVSPPEGSRSFAAPLHFIPSPHLINSGKSHDAVGHTIGATWVAGFLVALERIAYWIERD